MTAVVLRSSCFFVAAALADPELLVFAPVVFVRRPVVFPDDYLLADVFVFLSLPFALKPLAVLLAAVFGGYRWFPSPFF